MPNDTFKLEDRLLLFRFFNRLFGAEKFEELQNALKNLPEGYDSTGRSHFFHALKARAKISEDILAGYDANIREDTAAINRRRAEPIHLKYFQYLAALYSEIFLDWRANRAAAFLGELNAFVREENTRLVYDTQRYPEFEPRDLNKIAYWMATGSGKTLLLHINYRQFLRYQPDAGENILLITTSALLSEQHMNELRASDIPATNYADSAAIGVPNPVRVIEISKITENKTGGGVSVDVETFESRNLVFADEAHRGSSGEAWKNLRDQLGADGFTFEYSATFGQAINTARDADLLAEYSKAILFDYSYRYFHGDGYGKEYQVLNLREERNEDDTDTLLLANLLSFYEQARVYSDNTAQLKPYHLEPPLWIFIGSSVNAVYSEEREKKSDVLRVVLFLRHALDRAWAVKTIKQIFDGKAELQDKDGHDLFAQRFKHLRGLGMTPAEIYDDILRVFFRARGRGGLTLYEIKNADGEIGLRAGNSDEYFGVINIGDTTAFFKLAEAEGFTREQDAFSASLFDGINRPASRVNVLIGSKKFIEGWSSWRVSTMGLLNIGRAEGTQIIQLFGRGVRLLGKDRSLKRSAKLRERGHPPYLPILETLNIFGVRANYMSQFREFLNREGVPSEGFVYLDVPIKTEKEFLNQGLVVPRRKANAGAPPCWALTDDLSRAPKIDLRVQVTVIAGDNAAPADNVRATPAPRFAEEILSLLDWDSLYLDLLDFKFKRGWHNLALTPEVLRAILEKQQYTLFAAPSDVQPRRFADVPRVQSTVRAILEKYIEAFYQQKLAQWEARQLEYRALNQNDGNLNFGGYTLEIPQSQFELAERIKQLLADETRLYTRETDELPRVYFQRHLYQPLLLHREFLHASPLGLNESEEKFVRKLREWLANNPERLAGKEIFLLRNQSRGRGIGFFEEAQGFHPDFILWIKQGTKQRLVFVEPHGLTIGSDPEDEKVQLFHRIKNIERDLVPENPNVTLDSFLISASNFADLIKNNPAWRGNTRQDCAALHVLFEDSDLMPLFAE